MRQRAICTESRAKRVIAAVFCICFLSAAPTQFEWDVKLEPEFDGNPAYVAVVPSKLGSHPTFKSVYFTLFELIYVSACRNRPRSSSILTLIKNA
jgi:hypothetical protein